MTDAEFLAVVEARCNAATPGPWELDHDDTFVGGPMRNGDWDWIVGAIGDDEDYDESARGSNRANNCRFIATARSDVPRLLAMIRDRDACIAKLSAILHEWRATWG